MVFPKEHTYGCTKKFILFSAVAKWTEIRKNKENLDNRSLLSLKLKTEGYFLLQKRGDYQHKYFHLNYKKLNYNCHYNYRDHMYLIPYDNISVYNFHFRRNHLI